MPITYEPIATTTLGTAAASVTFSTISGAYTDLVLVAVPNSVSGNANLYAEFNADTATNYSMTELGGTGSVTASSRASNLSFIRLSFYGFIQANNNQNTIIQLQNYSNSTTYKTVLARSNNAGNGTGATVGLWRSTSAITSIKLYLDTATNFATGSTFTLYGIKAA
jgi:hypothetical protein